MKWEVQINGDLLDLKELSKSLVDDELRVFVRDGNYFLESNRLEGIANQEEVNSLAADILEMLTGAIRLSLGGRTPLRVINISMVSPGGDKTIFVTLSDTIRIMDTIGFEIKHSDGLNEAIHPAHSVPGWIKAALTDTSVAKALRLLGKSEYNWVNLYRLYEVIENDVGGLGEIVNRGWATTTSIRRFKHTANSPSAAGDASRHGKESTSPPAEPMDVSEARAVVDIILHNWLRSK